MNDKTPIDLKLLSEFDVSAPALIAETDIAKIWRVKRADEKDAVLKVYKGDDMRNEGPGVVYLQNCNGEAAAKIL